ncbi:MAG: hypothetical protein JWR44_3098 [Hymenobacter sp.]|jgi:broad specificity phosphatase PhoE|nr:hypothetical protein [Hymenobacter sp.]
MTAPIRLGFSLLALVTVLMGSAAAQTSPKAGKSKAEAPVTTVYLVRHAEKDTTSNPADPTLSAVGQVRAQALRQTLERIHPAALFTTNTTRTRTTLAPLAAATKLEPQVYDPRAGRALADLVLKNYTGKSVVIVGHSNTLLPLIKDFGAASPLAAIGDNEYSYLFIVRVTEGVSPTVEVRTYGAKRKPLGKAKAAPAMMAPASPAK